jgi:hypothetical protein
MVKTTTTRRSVTDRAFGWAGLFLLGLIGWVLDHSASISRRAGRQGGYGRGAQRGLPRFRDQAIGGRKIGRVHLTP